MKQEFELPAVGVCLDGSEGLHLHSHLPQQQLEEQEEEQDTKCKPFLWLGELVPLRRPEQEPLWLNNAITYVSPSPLGLLLPQWWKASHAALEDLTLNVMWPKVTPCPRAPCHPGPRFAWLFASCRSTLTWSC